MKKAEEYEGRDIMWYLEHPDELEKLMEGIIDDELTVGRIRSIYVQKTYGSKSSKEIAAYYDIPVKLVNDIAEGKVFREITNKDSMSDYVGRRIK